MNDHGGYPFPIELSRTLASRGHVVEHTFTAGLGTPNESLQGLETDPCSLTISPLVLRREFNRYGLIDRFMQERELGLLLKQKVREFSPDIVISANTPLGAQSMLLNEVRSQGAHMVFWLQDLLGLAIKVNLQKKLSLLGGFIGAYYMWLEASLLAKSQAVVVITEDFIPVCRHAGVAADRIAVVHNWAPLTEMPVRHKSNDWSRRIGIDQTFNFLYSGTLGMKHNPAIILGLALAFRGNPNARVVVVSEGIGADFLAARKAALSLDNLILLPFQPFASMPQVQASADVLIAIMEADAGSFAVPSKVLSYLCAQRPLLLAMPQSNLVASIVSENRCGVVVDSADSDGFVREAMALMDCPEKSAAMGANARRYAEKNFDIERITDRIEKIFNDIS